MASRTTLHAQAKGAVFGAQIVPKTGGETAFADLETQLGKR